MSIRPVAQPSVISLNDTPAAGQVPNASRRVAQYDAINMIERVRTATQHSDFMTETANRCSDVIREKQPGIRHTIEKWTIPPVAGLAAAGATLTGSFYAIQHFGPKAAELTFGLLWAMTKQIVSTSTGTIDALWQSYPLTTAFATTTCVAGAAAAIYRNPIDPKKVALKTANYTLKTLTTITLGAMWAIGGWAMGNLRDSYAQVEKDFAKLKANEYGKMISSLTTIYHAMGDELSARFLLAKDNPVEMDALIDLAKELNVKLKEATTAFRACGLHASDASMIFERLSRAIGVIIHRLELRSPTTQADVQYNLTLLQNNLRHADIGLSQRAKNECRRAQSSRLPDYHEALGYVRAGGIASLATVSVPAVMAGALYIGENISGVPFFANTLGGISSSNSTGTVALSVLCGLGTLTLGVKTGIRFFQHAVNQTYDQRERSEAAVRRHTELAVEELKRVYLSIAEYLQKEHKTAASMEQREQLKQNAFLIEQKLPSIEEKIRMAGTIDPDKILSPLRSTLKMIISSGIKIPLKGSAIQAAAAA